MNDDPAVESGESEGAQARFNATVRRMLKTPPKPHEDMKLGKPRRKRAKDQRTDTDCLSQNTRT